MTTEQMDEKDRQYNYVGVTAQSLVDGTAARRKRDAAQTPIVLYGTPSIEELAAARGRAGSRGVLVVPEEMRNEGLLVAADSEPDDNVSEPAFDEHFTSENVGREHITVESGQCWCGPQVERIPAEDVELPADHSIVDITQYSEDTMFKVQAAITSLGYSGQPVLDLIGAMQNAGILFREHAPDYDPVPARDYTPEELEKIKAHENGVSMAEEPIEQRLLRAFLNGFREGAERASWSGGDWDRR